MPHRVFALILLLVPSVAVAQHPLGDPTAAPTRALPPAVDASPWPALNDRRLKFALNPGPFASKFLSMPDAAPVEPRDGLFDPRGQLLTEGPNTSPIWNSSADLDVGFGMRLTRRTDVFVGFAVSPRGRFTPRADSATSGGPSVYFLQFSRKW